MVTLSPNILQDSLYRENALSKEIILLFNIPKSNLTFAPKVPRIICVGPNLSRYKFGVSSAIDFEVAIKSLEGRRFKKKILNTMY